MADAKLVLVANAIKVEMAEHEFCVSPKIERAYVTEIELQNLNELRVDVQPGDEDTEAADRSTIKHTCRVDVLVRKRFTADDEVLETGKISVQKIDELLRFMEEIHDFFHMRRLTEYDAAAWEGVEFRPIYYPDHLRNLLQFTGVVAVTYVVIA